VASWLEKIACKIETEEIIAGDGKPLKMFYPSPLKE
jgi:hypothetical protein